MSIEALVIYPHPLVALAIKVLLERQGIKAHCQSEARGAYDALQSRSYRLCLVDLSMPEAVGDVLPNEAKACGVQQVWAIANVHNQKAYRRKPERLYGADDYIELPSFCDGLATRLEHLGWCATGEAERRAKATQEHESTWVCNWILHHVMRVEQWSDAALGPELQLCFAQDQELSSRYDASQLERAQGYLRELVEQSRLESKARIAV